MATINVPGRCHFDSDGWLRGPINITHLMTPNRYDSGFTDNCRGMVQHTEDGFEAGTVATFMDETKQVSAFFSVDELGNAHQYLPLGHGYVAWAEGGANPYWRSCEAEDKTRTGVPMTGPQIAAFAQILEACSEYDGFPLQVTDDTVNGRGLITHGDGAPGWGDHPDCPGNVRKAQRPAIIALAKAIRAGGSQPAPPPFKTWTSQGQLTLAALCKAELHEMPSTVIRVTCNNSTPPGTFGPLVASYLNAVFTADTQLAPAGTTWTYPGGQWTSEGQLSLAALASEKLKATPAQVLALTATHGRDGEFSPDVAAYINDVLQRATIKLTSGTVLHY